MSETVRLAGDEMPEWVETVRRRCAKDRGR